MLHIKFQGYRSFDSGVEDFLSFYHMWVWWPYWSFEHIFVPSAPRGCTGDLVTTSPVALRRCLKLFHYESSGSKDKQ